MALRALGRWDPPPPQPLPSVFCVTGAAQEVNRVIHTHELDGDTHGCDPQVNGPP